MPLIVHAKWPAMITFQPFHYVCIAIIEKHFQNDRPYLTVFFSVSKRELDIWPNAISIETVLNCLMFLTIKSKLSNIEFRNSTWSHKKKTRKMEEGAVKKAIGRGQKYRLNWIFERDLTLAACLCVIFACIFIYKLIVLCAVQRCIANSTSQNQQANTNINIENF